MGPTRVRRKSTPSTGAGRHREERCSAELLLVGRLERARVPNLTLVIGVSASRRLSCISRMSGCKPVDRPHSSDDRRGSHVRPRRTRLQLARPRQAFYLFGVRAERGRARCQPEGPIIPSKLRHIPAASRPSVADAHQHATPFDSSRQRRSRAAGHWKPGRTHARGMSAATAAMTAVGARGLMICAWYPASNARKR